MDLLDLINETGGTIKVKYHTATLKLTKDILQGLRDKDIPTDVMTCIMIGLANTKGIDAVEAYLTEAEQCGAALSMTIEADDGKSLNITGNREDNPMVDQLVQAVENQ